MVVEEGTPPPAEHDEARLEMDYQQTLATWRMLVDLRFRLLAFVPAVAGVLVALAGRSPSASSALVAVVGLAALFGIVMYDLRNSQFHDATIHRAKELEKALALPRLSNKGTGSGGLMNERPRDRYRLAGVPVWHDRALFIVYAAAAAGLTSVGLLGVLTQLAVPAGWRLLGTAAAGVAAFTAVLVLLHKYGRQVDQPRGPYDVP
jgi:xanthosine utilization system XapX-like protein